ncbi:MAG: F0F1 ATP synthase subunit epsilon [Desulfobacterales bacterium]
MNLKILLPTKIMVHETVTKVNAEAFNGSFCLLPKHIDFVAALGPGILSYTNSGGQEVFLAVDAGTLIKKGHEVWVSTRRAIKGPDLEKLHETVEQEFKVLDEREKMVRSAAARIEASFVRRFLEIQGIE